MVEVNPRERYAGWVAPCAGSRWRWRASTSWCRGSSTAVGCPSPFRR